MKIIAKLSDVISQSEKLKIEPGLSPQTVRQWRKDIKSKHAASVSENERLRKCLDDREGKNYATKRRFEAGATVGRPALIVRVQRKTTGTRA